MHTVQEMQKLVWSAQRTAKHDEGFQAEDEDCLLTVVSTGPGPMLSVIFAAVLGQSCTLLWLASVQPLTQQVLGRLALGCLAGGSGAGGLAWHFM